MNHFTYQYKTLFIVGLLSISSYAIADEVKDNSCMSYDRNVTQELELLSHAIKATPTSISIKKAYQIQLAPQSDIIMLAEPNRISLDDASFALILPLDIPKTGDYRVSISSEAWIDVIKNTDKNNKYEVVSSNDFTGHADCKILRKLVEFSLDKNEQYFLQLSGATSSNITILVTPFSQQE